MASVEHQEYIQKKVNPILEALVTSVLLDRPEEPIGYMINWLKKKDSTTAGASVEDLKLEVESLKKEIHALEEKMGVTKDGGEDEESEEDNDDDVVDDLPPPSGERKQRGSVSAEATGDFNPRKDYTPVENPKSDAAKERIKEVMQKSFLFSSLPDADKKIIVGAVTEQKADKGERVITQGEDGDCMFIVEEGEFDCLKNGSSVKICKSGDAFGELALLYNTQRAASVDCVSDSGLLWKLDRETFNAIVRDGSIKRRETNEAFIKQVDVLGQLDTYERSQVADALKMEEHPADATIVTQGELGETLYFLKEGTCVAWKEEAGGMENPVKEYSKAGEYFGELALLDDAGSVSPTGKRKANITTKTKCKFATIDRITFKRMLGSVEEIMKRNAANY